MSNLTTHKGFAPQTITEAIQFSEMLSKSQMVPRNYQNKPEDIMVAVQWGMEIGLAPLQALQNISVINGRPSVYGDAAMALVQASPVCEGVEETIEGEGTSNPVAVCIASRKGRKPVTARFSVEDAKRAGLWGKSGPWSAYPKRMLQMRARGFALRDAFPDVLKGLITAEEAQDFPDDAKPVPVRDITPENPLDTIEITKLIEPAYEPTEPEVEEDIQPQDEATQDEVIEAIEVHEAVMQEATSDITQESVGINWPLSIPNKEPVIYATQDEWLVEYNKLADKVATAGRTPPRQRMTKLRELREANDMVIQRIPTMARVVMSQGYQTRLRHLGAMLREEEGTADPVRQDNGGVRA